MCHLQIRKIKLNQKLNNLLHFHESGNQVLSLEIPKFSSLDFQRITDWLGNYWLITPYRSYLHETFLRAHQSRYGDQDPVYHIAQLPSILPQTTLLNDSREEKICPNSTTQTPSHFKGFC